MDLVSWSLNAIDQIFSTGRQGKGETSCPDGTFFSGYTMDYWQKWRIVCLTTMSVEDVEDVYIIGLLITGFLLFGVCGYLANCEIGKCRQQFWPLQGYLAYVKGSAELSTLRLKC
ncbi:hypothetical protein ATANTOWER_029240 [Ataeniobius toweri]|uniref:Uncharacterized protein n=1 Tax=Ataeniobius toweri TaxID=208326 RepID=A0ABU7CDG6_9TELE|nr:hypothetical protein [Ataeniobius toweri]